MKGGGAYNVRASDTTSLLVSFFGDGCIIWTKCFGIFVFWRGCYFVWGIVRTTTTHYALANSSATHYLYLKSIHFTWKQILQNQKNPLNWQNLPIQRSLRALQNLQNKARRA